MNRDELRDRINAAEDIETAADRWGLERDKRHKGWVCPDHTCNNGKGNDGDGITRVPGSNRLHCFKCKRTYDIIELIKATQNADYNAALQIGADRYGIATNGMVSTPARAQTPGSAPKADPTFAEEPDGTAFEPFEGIRQDKGDTLLPIEGARAYLEARGLPGEYADEYGILHANHWNRVDGRRVPSIIYPTGGTQYQCKRLQPDHGPGASKGAYTSGSTSIFNARALRENDVVAVTEGAEDALAMIAAGCPAISLQGSKERPLLKVLDFMRKRNEIVPRLLLALDDDKEGRKCAENLTRSLAARGIAYAAPADLYGDANDANEAWQKDRNAFTVRVAAACDDCQTSAPSCDALQAGQMLGDDIARKDLDEILHDTTPLPDMSGVSDMPDAPPTDSEGLPADADAARRQNEEKARREELTMRARLSAVGAYRWTFQAHIDSGFGTPVPTGFKNSIDKVFDGGFRPGLYVFGAGTGIGKTTLALQIADNVAANGHPVLYVSMEMSRDELIGKSICRIARQMAEDDEDMNFPGLNAVLQGNGGPFAARAQEKYFDIMGRHMHMIEGIGDQSAGDVRIMADAIAQDCGTAPFIVIDYVQILASPDVHLSDKQAVDRNTYALKRISRDLNVPVIAISTMNRASYGFNANTPNADMLGALKESGALEYTGDAAIILYQIGQEIDGGGERMEARIIKGRRLDPRAGWLRFTSYGGSSYMRDDGTTPYRDIKRKGGCTWSDDDFEEYIGPMPDFGENSNAVPLPRKRR